MTGLLPVSLIRLHTSNSDGRQRVSGELAQAVLGSNPPVLIHYPDCHSVASPASLTSLRAALFLRIYCLKISKRQILEPMERFTFHIKIKPPS